MWSLEWETQANSTALWLGTPLTGYERLHKGKYKCPRPTNDSAWGSAICMTTIKPCRRTPQLSIYIHTLTISPVEAMACSHNLWGGGREGIQRKAWPLVPGTREIRLKYFQLSAGDRFGFPDTNTTGIGLKRAGMEDSSHRKLLPQILTSERRTWVVEHGLLTIRVLDSNDNVPAFDQPVYTVSLPENSPPGTLVLQLNASDPDEGANGEVVYAFSSHASARARELFGLSPRTGRLEVSGELDYEESPLQQVYVQAKDLGPNAVPAHCKVLVRVLDANDNAPEISFSTVKEAVSEGAAPGTVVALFSVADRDADENGRVRCELLGDAPFLLKPSFQNYYTLVTAAPLDREAGDAYTLTVVARDGGAPALATSRSIRVRVADVNDNAPRFSQPLYDVHVTENNVPGAYIYAVSATDRDEGANARLAYAILESQIQGMSVATYVSVNAENGYLYALRSFDYEQLKAFSFQVEARDAGSPQALAGNATVRILVVDQNDNAPAIVAPLPGLCSFTTIRQLVKAKRHVSNNRYQNKEIIYLSPIDNENELIMELLISVAFRLLVSRPSTPEPVSTLRRMQDLQVFVHLFSTGPSTYIFCTAGPIAKSHWALEAEQRPFQGGVLWFSFTGLTTPLPSAILRSDRLTKHQRTELSYLVDRPRRVNSSAFQEADIVSSKDSGHGDSEQGDSDHDATNRGQSAGMDLFSNCTEECKALGHSDRCWMPSFVPSDGRQAADYRSNLHVPGMDSVPDTEVFEAPEAQPGAERSFSTFGKEKALHSTLERKELDGLLSNTRAPYKPPYLKILWKQLCGEAVWKGTETTPPPQE
ncbi:PREDICTED: protocadherin-10 [Dipodomys ordii]|uniref:Protocadherin-10 n=1 Tax=Dipodomys ordii TaxID=10020 RepID=A0A1S3G819_DIPOR|nr:PREDICTED: protocadherin-10 [Dipodomys ordii]